MSFATRPITGNLIDGFHVDMARVRWRKQEMIDVENRLHLDM
ncbi:hypothetical protein [Acidisphaera rubrifaciens]|nr:hypothetical protein [Acidisphaera rubrifaciens]